MITENLRPPLPITADTVVRLAQQNSLSCGSQVPSIFSSTSHSTFLSYLQSPSVNITEYVSSLVHLIALAPPDPSLFSLLSSLLISYLRLFYSRKTPRDRNSLQIFHLFSMHLVDFPKETLTSLIDMIVDDLPEISEPDDTQPLELLPRLLSIVKYDEEIENGSDFVDSVLDHIMDSKWSKVLIVKVVSMLREFPFTDKIRPNEFVRKVFDEMKVLDLQDIPLVVYQLLILASNGFNKKALLEGIIGFFGRNSGAKGSSIVRQVEGTVLLHFNFAVKQDPSVAQEFLNLVKTNLGAFNQFTVAMLLSIARIRRFNENAIGILKAAVITCYKDYMFSRNCKWIPEKMKDDCLQSAKYIENAVIKSINESNHGREHITASIIQFGFSLLESAECNGNEEFLITDDLVGIEGLGIQIVKTLFEVQDMARNEIIERCKFCILSLKPQQNRSIIKLLGNLVQGYPYPMLDHVSRIKELLDYLIFMPDKTATFVIASLLPMMKFSRELQDYTVLVLRKAMFRQEEHVRFVATNSILDLILLEQGTKKNEANSFDESSSQASCSQQADVPSGLGKNLFQELSGLLRRCLSQQARVKEVLYEGLVKIVLLDPFIAGSVLDFLWPHFLHYYDEDSNFPLNINNCIKVENGVLLEEPLDCLLSCVSWILLLQSSVKTDNLSEHPWTSFGFSLSQENEAGTLHCGELFSNALSKIKQCLKNANIQSFESNSKSSAEKNGYSKLILKGIFEVMLNALAIELEKAENKEKETLQGECLTLIDLYGCLDGNAFSTKPGNDIKKASSTCTIQERKKIPPTPNDGYMSDKACDMKGCPRIPLLNFLSSRPPFLSTLAIHQLLVTAITSASGLEPNAYPVSQIHSQLSISKQNTHLSGLITFSFKICLHQLRHFSKMRNNDPLMTLLCGDIKILAIPLFKLILFLKLIAESEVDQKTKGRKKRKKALDEIGEQIQLSLMCLYELLKLCLDGPDVIVLLEDLLSIPLSRDIENAQNSGEDENHEMLSTIEERKTISLHLFIWKILKPLLYDFLQLSFYMEVQILSDMVFLVGKQLPCKLRNTHGDWVIQICKNETVKSSRAARNMVTLGITLTSPPNDLIILQDVALELTKVMGSEERDPVEKSEVYPIVNISSKNAISYYLLQMIESVIVSIDWNLSKLKRLSSFNYESVDAERNYENLNQKTLASVLEEELYSKSDVVVNLLSSFTNMNLQDPQAEQLLKLTAKFYKLLACMTKLRIARKSTKQLPPGPRFQKLAEITCSKLTGPLYNFVALMQRNQQENMQRNGMINKIKRENRCIPDLIFQIEDYEKYLIQLSKLTKVNLLRHAKRSTSRDFKILDVKMTNGQEDENIASQNESCGESEEQERHRSQVNSHDIGVSTNSGSDSEDQEMIIKNKRTKMSNIVQESDNEA